jgi:hypothetical protein
MIPLSTCCGRIVLNPAIPFDFNPILIRFYLSTPCKISCMICMNRLELVAIVSEDKKGQTELLKTDQHDECLASF